MKRKLILAGVIATVSALTPFAALAADDKSATSAAGIASDTIWVVVAALLVMFMQAGFAMLEVGFSRMKNVGTVVAKVITNFAAGQLSLAVPSRSGVLAAAQFPTLWGDVTRPARYLDALLADCEGRPWAVELKDQDAGGGHGAYLRHGIGQAVLYRH